MQKLQLEFQNVPTDASQVCSTTSLSLNKEETISVTSKVLNCNNPDVNQVQQTERSLKAFVFVLSKCGKPLMPCGFAKSKRMVKKGCCKGCKTVSFDDSVEF